MFLNFRLLGINYLYLCTVRFVESFNELSEDDLRIETCWSDFKCFNVKFYVCALVGVLINPLNAQLNPICHLLALLGAHHILHVSRIRVK